MYKEKINLDFNKMKKKALLYSNSGKTNKALNLVAFASRFMYKINSQYSDQTLENVLEAEAEKLKPSLKAFKKNEKKILFYDSAGLNLRGLASLYLGALVNLEYQITYVVNKDRKGKIPDLEKMLLKGRSNKIIYVDYKESHHTIIELREYIVKEGVSKFLCYGFAHDVIGPTLAGCMKNYIMSYYISTGDHAYWVGSSMYDKIIEYRDYGASISHYKRNISKTRIVKQPFYPVISEMPFQGFPFEKGKNKVIFSGGELYKTFGAGNLYYVIVKKILRENMDTIFYYAGKGDGSELRKLQTEFPNRVYWTDERKDFYQVIQNSDIYLSTYPIVGGQMLQYAVAAQKPPFTLWHDECADGFLLDSKKSEVFCYTEEEVLNKINAALRMDNIQEKYSNCLNGQIINKDDFLVNLERILNYQNSIYKIEYEPLQTQSLVDTFMQRLSKKEYYRLYSPLPYDITISIWIFPIKSLICAAISIWGKIKNKYKK